jgi:hypothetical protein
MPLQFMPFCLRPHGSLKGPRMVGIASGCRDSANRREPEPLRHLALAGPGAVSQPYPEHGRPLESALAARQLVTQGCERLI